MHYENNYATVLPLKRLVIVVKQGNMGNF